MAICQLKYCTNEKLTSHTLSVKKREGSLQIEDVGPGEAEKEKPMNGESSDSIARRKLNNR